MTKINIVGIKYKPNNKTFNIVTLDTQDNNIVQQETIPTKIDINKETVINKYFSIFKIIFIKLIIHKKIPMDNLSIGIFLNLPYKFYWNKKIIIF